MTVERATVLLVLKRLATSRSTYKLIGLLLVAFGVTSGSDVMGWVSTLVRGFWWLWRLTINFGRVNTLPH